jgi:hypothetical protein
MRDETNKLTLAELQGPIDQLRAQLRDKGWAPYKSQELRDPTEQWTVRSGYVGGETYLYVSRFSQARFDQHVASVDPYETVARVRLWPRMDDDPTELIRQALADTVFASTALPT